MASNNKRPLEKSSPDKNSPKRFTSSSILKMANDFSWDKFKEILNETFDYKLKDVATKDDISSLNKRISQLQDENESLRSEINTLRGRMERMDQNNRRCNVVINGYLNIDTAAAFKEFVKLSKDVLKTDVDVVEASKLYKPGSFIFKLGSQQQMYLKLKCT